MIHRDLKTDNILFHHEGQEHIKIIDFGFTYTNEHKQIDAKLGTPLFIAPEVIKKNYNEKCDVWSMGVILFFCLSGTYPFTGLN